MSNRPQDRESETAATRMTACLLGLAFRSRAWALGSVTLVLGVLLATMPHHVGLFDEGELAVAAYELGLGHPPGQPLHTLLGAIFAHLPAIAPATGLAVLSALAAAFAVLPALAIAESALPDDAPSWLAPACIVTVALHGIVWEASTRIEVYPLAVVCGLFALARVIQGALHPLRAGLLLGLSACANPVLAALFGVATLPFLVGSDRAAARRFGAVFLGGIAGLLPYAYLAVAARRNDAFVWGGLDSAQELTHYLMGRDYAGNLGATREVRLEQALAFLDYVGRTRAFGGVLLTAVLGLFCLVRRAKPLLASLVVLLLGPVIVVSSNTVFGLDVPDYLGYFACGAYAAAIASAVAIDESRRRSRLAPIFVLAFALGSVVGTPSAWSRTRADDDVCMRVARAVLDSCPRGAVLILESDHLISPALFAQRVEHHRTDVVVVARGLMASSWYLRLLATQHPTLAPYRVRGPGERDGRIGRLLAANPSRRVRLEHPRLAGPLRLSVCPAGIVWVAGSECAMAPPALDFAPLYRVAARARALPDGAIDGRLVISAITYRLGLDLQRAGRSREAYAVLVAGLPNPFRGGFLPPASRIPEWLVLEGPDPHFARRTAIADPARNAFVLGHLLVRAGQTDAAVAITVRAADDGLPEAIDLLRRASRPTE